jgi:Tol biopolymer transport system component
LLAFVEKSGEETRIKLLRRTNGRLRTENVVGNAGTVGHPRISPNGKQIVYHANGTGSYQIFVTDLNGSRRQQLTSSAGDNRNPSWSPDGKSIAFDSTRFGQVDLFQIDIDGGNEQRVTTGLEDESQPDFSPDGTSLVFVAVRDDQIDLYMLNLDSTEVTRVTANVAIEAAPRFAAIKGKVKIYFLANNESEYLDPVFFADLIGREDWGLFSITAEGIDFSTEFALTEFAGGGSVERGIAIPKDPTGASC